jgi:hypothetical protein
MHTLFAHYTVAALFLGAIQSDVSRDLRRLLSQIQQCLPCPVVWEPVAADPAEPYCAPSAPRSWSTGGCWWQYRISAWVCSDSEVGWDR